MALASVYEPLDVSSKEIRLLHLLPVNSSRPAEIHCEISVTSIKQSLEDGKPPDYEALSYAWGDRNDTETILVRNRKEASSNSSPLRITRNLHVALSNLRFTDRERILWIDAVSINQADEAEKTLQVALMKDIYKGASAVNVFLGPSSEGTDRAMEFIESASKDKQLHLDPSKTPHIAVEGSSLESPKLRDALVSFFDMPWWRRVWTVQEFALAKTVDFQCGVRTLKDKTLKTAWRHMMHHGDTCCVAEDYTMLINPSLEANVGVWDAFVRYDALRDLPDGILVNAARFLARISYDPRDKIYGMLGLASKAEETLISADYSSPVEEVFKHFAMITIKRTGRLDILSYVSRDRNIAGLPSYVPDFTVAYDDLTVSRLFYRYEMLHLYSPAGKSKAKWKPAGPNSVTVQGLIFDEVVETGPHFRRSSDSLVPQLKKVMRTIDALGEEPTEHSPDKRPRMPAQAAKTAWQTLVAGIAPKLADGSDIRANNESDYKAYLVARDELIGDDKEQTEEEMNDVDWLWRRIRTAVVGGRTFITTKKGFIGLAPGHTEKGDQISVLAGGRVPYILRKEQTPPPEGSVGPVYSFVGDSYVHGIMDGEAFGLLDKEDGEFQEMILV